MPPRLAKVKAEEIKEKRQYKVKEPVLKPRKTKPPSTESCEDPPPPLMPKIENWDNEMANNIPASQAASDALKLTSNAATSKWSNVF